MTLVPNPVVFTVGIWLTDLWAAGFALFLLSFPTGRLTSRADTAIVGIFLFVVIPLEFLWLLFWVPDNGLNVLAIAPNESAAKVVDTIQRALTRSVRCSSSWRSFGAGCAPAARCGARWFPS